MRCQNCEYRVIDTILAECEPPGMECPKTVYATYNYRAMAEEVAERVRFYGEDAEVREGREHGHTVYSVWYNNRFDS